VGSVATLERITAKIIVFPETGCWLWQGNLTRDGYGTVKIDGKTMLVHRVMYALHVGEIPIAQDGKPYVIDHMNGDRGPCRFRNCCNPAHLQAVTWEQNAAFVIPWNSKKEVCPQGHEYDRFSVDKKGVKRRHCKQCDKAAADAYRARKRAERVAA
jgi:hypothetical protein